MPNESSRSLFDDDQTSHALELQQAFELFETGQFDLCERAIDSLSNRGCNDPDILNLRGLLALNRTEHARARALFAEAKAINPERALYQFNYGIASLADGDITAAIEAFEQACILKPVFLGAWKNLGLALHQSRRFARAADVLERVLRLEPVEDNRLSLANSLAESGIRFNNTNHLQQAKDILCGCGWHADNQLHAEVLLARICEAQGELTQATQHYQKLISIRPQYPGYHNNLARCLTKLGRPAEAARHYFRTYELAPNFPDAYSSMLSCLNYGPADSIGSYPDAVRAWESSVASRHYPSELHFENDRTPDRPLRVGYLSPDLRQHVVGKLFLPILSNHDRNQVFAACYHIEPRIDELSRQIAGHADLWRHLPGSSDEEIATLIRDDEIDILVDLSGHTAYSRPLVFARKPAPIQVSWLGYFNTTGLATMDWFITDVHSSGPEQEAQFSERLYRLPSTRFCYEPYPQMEEVSELPALRAGRITFGSLNNLAKLNKGLLRVWSQVLSAVPESRLLIQSSALRDKPNREKFIAACIESGIDPDRLDARADLPLEQFSRTYSEIDIALDPFPFCGGVTSFDALWMGVPVVTLVQENLAGRQTYSMLRNLGLDDLVARTVDEYVAIATALAGDQARLERLRSSLRERFKTSPLLDYPQLARELEKAYRFFWQTWLGSQAERL